MGTFELVKWILIGLFVAGLAAAGYGVWTGFTGSYEMKGAVAQQKADAAELTKANGERDAAVQRASVAEESAANNKAGIEKQNAALAVAATSQAAAEKAARDIAIKYANAVAQGQIRDAKLAELARVKPADGRTCDQVLGATDTILRESARARQAP